MMLQLAPLGLVIADPFAVTEEYLNLGLFLSEVAGDPDMLRTMLASAKTRGDKIITAEMFQHFREELNTMGSDVAEIMDSVTGGRYSYLEKELKGKDRELKGKDKAIARAVLTFNSDHKSVNEISRIMGITLAEVGAILDANGRGA
jgi:hypothetical protein